MHYARLAAVPIEYLSRLDAALRHNTAWSSRIEHKAIRDKILELCDACKSKIWEEAPLFRTLSTSETITDAQELALRSLLRTTSGAFTALHELLLFLPRELTRRELNDFCKSLFRNEYDNTKISLILTSLFNAFEYSLDDVMRFLETDVFKFKIPDPEALHFGNVMELAIVDRNNPLSWAVLAHEFGHYLDNQAGITARAIQEYAQQAFKGQQVSQELITTFERLGNEMVADITGYYLLGPCSILPLVSMSLLVGCLREEPIKFDGEHGAPTSRIQMVTSMCVGDNIDHSLTAPMLDVFIAEEQSKEATLGADQKEQRERIHEFLIALCQEVRPLIVEELKERSFQQFTSVQHTRAQRLARSLAAGLPIGACRTYPEEEASAQLLTPTNSAQLREQYYLLTEDAVSVSEVITAGWITRAQRTNDILDRAFAMSSAQQAFDSITRDLEEQDRLILKSIDTIAMLESYHAASG